MPLYALNLFDLAPNDDYRAYSKRSVAAVGKYGGTVTALGRLSGAAEGDVAPRQVMVLVEWPSREAFDAFVADPEHHDLHPLREGGTQKYLWWLYEKLEDLRPIFALGRPEGLAACTAERVLNVDPAAVWDVAADPSRLAQWFAGVEAVDVDGRLGQGQRHVARGVDGEVERVIEDWEPQGYVRWRDLRAPVGAWLELRIEPSGTGVRAEVTERWVEADAGGAGVDGARERLDASLERLAALLHA